MMCTPVYASEIHAHEMHAYEGFCEDLARQNTVAHLSQLQLRFRRRHTWVSMSSPWCPKGHYLGRRTVCLGTSAHRSCFDLSVCLSITFLSI
jgi:hypothetical protein